MFDAWRGKRGQGTEKGSEVEGESVWVWWECWTMATGTLMEGRHTDY